MQHMLGFIVYSIFFVYVCIVRVWATLPELNKLDGWTSTEGLVTMLKSLAVTEI